MAVREVQVNRVARVLGSRGNVSLTGLPGSGKTVIATRVVESLNRQGIWVVDVPASQYSSGYEYLDGIARALDCPEEESSSTLVEHFRRVRRHRSIDSKPAVLLLDRFDRVRHFEDAPQLLEVLRELISQPSLALSALIVSRRSLASLEEDVRGLSTIASVCYAEIAGALRTADLQGDYDSADSDEISSAIVWGGGSAVLVDYRIKVGFAESESDLQTQKATHYASICRYLSDTDLLPKVIQWVLGPVWDEGFNDRQTLQALGILRMDEGGVCLADDPVFQNALLMANRSLDAWGILGQAEIKTRSLIEQRMRDVYGTAEWWTKIPKGLKPVQDVLANAADQQTRDQRTWGNVPPLLACTYPDGLWTIIGAHWGDFKDVLGRDKAYWTQVFHRISRGRNPYAHHKVGDVLSTEDRLNVSESCRILLRALEPALAQPATTH